MSNCKAAANDMAAAAAAHGKKRKAGTGEPELSVTSAEFKTQRLDVFEPENSGNSACESMNSDRVSASCCSSNGSKSVDLEENEAELIATSVDSIDRRESEVHAQPGELESSARPPLEMNPNASIPTNAKTPSDAELEEFFSAAEKNLQQKFIEKYNYDIVKDEPLAEGRYEWVPIQLKP